MKYDYRSIKIPAGKAFDLKVIDQEINKLANEAWELVQVLPTTEPGAELLAFMRRIKDNVKRT